MAQVTSKEIIEPPSPPVLITDFAGLNNYLNEVYRRDYSIWKRIGGYTQAETGFKNMSYQNANNITITGGRIETTSIVSCSIAGATITNSTFQTGSISNVDLSNSDLSDCGINQGGSSLFIGIGGNAFNSIIPKGSSGIVETNLIEYLMPANSMNADGIYIELEAWGTFAANSSNKTLRLYLGTAVLLEVPAIAANGGSWVINSSVVRASSSAQKANSKIISSNTSVGAYSSVTSPTADTTGVISIKCTGKGTSNNDVVQDGLIVKFFNVR